MSISGILTIAPFLFLAGIVFTILVRLLFGKKSFNK